MTGRRRAGLVVLGLVVLVALAGRQMLSGFLRSMIYPAPPVPVPSPPRPPLAEVALESDGLPLSAWWLPSRSAETPVVLMLHGNGENLATLEWSGLFGRFAELDAAVLALDYPGYGRSGGSPDETSILAATRSAWREVRRRAGAARPRVACGWSLGAAAAAQLAAAEPATVDALVLMSPWTRLGELAAVHFPAWLAGPLLPDRYDTLAAAPGVRSATLVVHGADDELVPVEQGRRVFAALPEPKRWLEVPAAGHNDLLARPETWQALARALAEAERR